jgi:hypothetical protein
MEDQKWGRAVSMALYGSLALGDYPLGMFGLSETYPSLENTFRALAGITTYLKNLVNGTEVMAWLPLRTIL